MSQILCTECNNDYLEKTENGLCCASCGAVFSEEDESLLLGIRNYIDNNYEEADSALMKALVKDGHDMRALFYKGLCEAAVFDEDTVSFAEVYKKIEYALSLADDEALPEYLEKANNEAEKFESAMTELHVRAFEGADAEKIKREVAVILRIRDEALAHRAALTKIAEAYNERSERKIITRFSKCSFVSGELANEVGCAKLQKIKDDIGTHTVFTGILTNDIRNLEIYYRCVVMFLEKSKEKYNFLLNNAKKFIELSELLKDGGYTSVNGTEEIAEKLRLAAYGFFEDSLKEHDDEFPDEELPVVEFEPLPEPVVDEAVVEIPEEPQTETAAETDGQAEAEKADTVDASQTENSKEKSTVTEAAAEVTETPVPEDAEAFAAQIPVEEETAESVSDKNDIPAGNTENADENVSAQSEAEQITKEASEENSVDSVSFREKSSVSTLIEAAEKPIFEEAADAKQETPAFDEITQIVRGEPVFEETAQTEQPADSELPKKVLPQNFIRDTEPEKNEKPAVPVRKKKKKKHIGLIILIVALAGGAAFAGWKYIPGFINEKKYTAAAELESAGSFSEAAEAYKELGEYKDSADKVLDCEYQNGEALEEKGEYEKAISIFEKLPDYKDCATRISACKYELAKAALDSADFDEAKKQFEALADYGDSAEKVQECDYRKALTDIEEKKYTEALELLTSIKDYPEAAEKIKEVKYLFVSENLNSKDKATAKKVKAYLKELAAEKYRNSADLQKEIVGEESSSAKVSLFVNTSATDLKEKLTSIDRSSKMYFHINTTDKSLYGKAITLTYKTQYDFTYSKTVKLSKGSPSAYLDYPKSTFGNFTVTFTASVDGVQLGKPVTVTVK